MKIAIVHPYPVHSGAVGGTTRVYALSRKSPRNRPEVQRILESILPRPAKRGEGWGEGLGFTSGDRARCACARPLSLALSPGGGEGIKLTFSHQGEAQASPRLSPAEWERLRQGLRGAGRRAA